MWNSHPVKKLLWQVEPPTEAAQFQGIVEGQNEGVLIAASLNQPDEKGRILLRCLNLSDQPVKLAAGAVVEDWHRAGEDVQEGKLGCKSAG